MKHLSFRPLCQRRPLLRLALPAIVALALFACQPKPAAVSDSNTPLHLLQPQYDTPYGVPSQESVHAVVDRVSAFVEQSTPMALDGSDHVHQGAFRLTSYEWGVTYGAMLSASRAIGNESYARYAVSRMAFLADCYPHFRELYEAGTLADGQMRQVVHPQALDDAGAVCTAMIKAQMADSTLALRPLIDNYMDYILHQEYRLPDGTFARMRPLADAVWLDDMFMAIPAIVWYGRLTDSDSIVSEAVRQVRLFADKMWVPECNLFRHGWVASMPVHPSFHWARANGWALLTLTEMLDALPVDHPDRPFVLDLYVRHTHGLLALQSGEGFWHQLLDRSDSYLETSATAIYAYCLAHGIRQGWLSPEACAPAVLLAWNAVATKVSDDGHVHGTCVGTGMGFDPAFYYYRPVHDMAAHGYGPVVMAGAEVYALLNEGHIRLNDSAVHYYSDDYSNRGPIFSVAR